MVFDKFFGSFAGIQTIVESAGFSGFFTFLLNTLNVLVTDSFTITIEFCIELGTSIITDFGRSSVFVSITIQFKQLDLALANFVHL